MEENFCFGEYFFYFWVPDCDSISYLAWQSFLFILGADSVVYLTVEGLGKAVQYGIKHKEERNVGHWKYWYWLV